MKVVLAIDGSSSSEVAARSISVLFTKQKAQVTTLTVIPEHIFLGGHTIAHLLRCSPSSHKQLNENQKQLALELVNRINRVYFPEWPGIESEVRWGNPSQEITKACYDLKADLVVIGSKGMSNSREFLLGSIANKVLKYAPCNVLMIKKEIRAAPKIIVPLDGSKYSNEAISFLMRMPLPRHTEIHLITVLQSFAATLVRSYTLNMEHDINLIDQIRQAEEDVAKELLGNGLSQLGKRGYKISSSVLRGEPSQEIIEETIRVDTDVIALGAKGLTGIQSYLLGSVTQRVARYAQSSVLVVKTKTD
ncbi:MAG: universal stress protein [Chloroflexota bacterium]|nr:universal stress protein [Chloroflexota bacterium]